MAETSRPSVGELIVRNGSKRGTRIPLRLPATLVGSGPQCDVRLTADTVGELHCLITATPAGPVLRSWHPQHTRRNGTPTASAVLASGDELRVGPCSFTLVWSAPQQATKPETVVEEPVVETVVAEVEPVLVETAVEAEPVDDFAMLWVAPPEAEVVPLEETLAELAEIETLKQQALKVHAAAKAERDHVRQVAKRFYRKLKSAWAGERKKYKGERAAFDLERKAHAAAVAKFAAERWEAGAYRKRLYEAWELLGENQRRVLADRKQAEQWVAEQTYRLDSRKTEVADREQRVEEKSRLTEARARDLADEIANLEGRAANLRGVIARLNEQRTATPAAVPAVLPAVSLDAPAGVWSSEADELVSHLREAETAVQRDRQKVEAAKQQLTRYAADLRDQKAVLAEQVAALAAASTLWQTAETRTLAELEHLARAIQKRELELDEREQMLTAAEVERRTREQDLWRLRLKLDDWNIALTAQETALAAARELTETDLAATLELARREHSQVTLTRVRADVDALIARLRMDVPVETVGQDDAPTRTVVPLMKLRVAA